MYYFVATDEERLEYVSSIRPLAKKYDEYLIFLTVDALEYPDMGPNLGLSSGAKRGLVVQNPSKGQVFPLRKTKGITPDVIESFIMELSSGKVEPWDFTPVPPDIPHDEL